MTIEPQLIGRHGSFDSAHRVMNEKMKCFNLHGHTYLYELQVFGTNKEIGYAIDFKEIKRVPMQYIDDYLDHGIILNPEDEELLNLCLKNGWKLWVMRLNGDAYCNPTVENIAKEVFLIIKNLLPDGIGLHSVKVHETPNCYAICEAGNISAEEVKNFEDWKNGSIVDYKFKKGVFEYDDRK